MAVLNLELICHYINEQLDQLAVDNECKWIYHRQVEHRMTGLAKGYWTITETFTWPKIMKFVTVLLTAAFVVDSTNGIQSQDYQNMLNYMKANEELFRQFLSLDEPCGPNKEYVKLIPPPNMECLKPPEPPMEWLGLSTSTIAVTVNATNSSMATSSPISHITTTPSMSTNANTTTEITKTSTTDITVTEAASTIFTTNTTANVTTKDFASSANTPENQKQAGLTIGLIIGVSVIAVCIILLIVGYKKHYQK
ncbi:uncharacterized protein LOC141900499 isoform X4 [Tubulanus polymorphus]